MITDKRQKKKNLQNSNGFIYLTGKTDGAKCKINSLSRIMNAPIKQHLQCGSKLIQNCQCSKQFKLDYKNEASYMLKGEWCRLGCRLKRPKINNALVLQAQRTWCSTERKNVCNVCRYHRGSSNKSGSNRKKRRNWRGCLLRWRDYSG